MTDMKKKAFEAYREAVYEAQGGKAKRLKPNAPTSMFAGYARVDWSHYDLAPRLVDLQTLATPNARPAAVDQALSYIGTAIFDQGCATRGVLETVPLLVEILPSRATGYAKARVLRLLAAMLTEEQDFLFERFTPQEELSHVVLEGCAEFLPLVTDRDPAVRRAAGHILAYAPKGKSQLRAALAREKDPATLATLILAAAVLRETLDFKRYLKSPRPIVRSAAALAALAPDGKALEDEAVARALIAALADRAIDGQLPFFSRGRLREAILDALRRFGRGRPTVIDALIPLRHDKSALGDGTLGRKVVGTLAQIATPAEGKPDADGRRILIAILDARPQGFCGLPLDPVELRRLLGLEAPAPPSPLSDRLGKQTIAATCVKAICGSGKLDPVVRSLHKALDEDRRIALSRALLLGEEGTGDHWDYANRELWGVCERRWLRLCQLCHRLLAGADGARLLAELTALETRANALGKGHGMYNRERNQLAMAGDVFVFAAASAHLDGKERFPSKRLRRLAEAADHDRWRETLRALLPRFGKDADALVRLLQYDRWRYADLISRSVIPDILKKLKQRDYTADTQRLRVIAEALCKQGRRADADQIMRAAAKSTFDNRRITWTTADGMTLTIRGT